MSACPSCSSRTDLGGSRRLVQDTCGHSKCRMCLLKEEHGCGQCLAALQQQRRSVIVRRVQHRDETGCSGKEAAAASDDDGRRQGAEGWTTTGAGRLNNFPVGRSGGGGGGPVPLHASGSLLPDLVLGHEDLPPGGGGRDAAGQDDPEEAPSQAEASPGTVARCHEVIQRGKQVSLGYMDLAATESGRRRHRRSGGAWLHRHKHIVQTVDEAGVERYSCTECKASFKNRYNVRYHVGCADRSACLMCHECGRGGFKSASHLKYHARSAHKGEMPYKCEICDKAFPQVVKLKRHRLTHSENRPFVCQVCSKAFKAASSLKEHQAIHDVKLHKPCDSCGRKFADKNNLRRHSRLCQGDGSYRRFRCEADRCEEKFRTASELRKHRVSSHGLEVERFPCSVCDKVLGSARDRARHAETVHGTSGVRCPQCPSVFKRRDNMKRHLRLVHKVVGDGDKEEQDRDDGGGGYGGDADEDADDPASMMPPPSVTTQSAVFSEAATSISLQDLDDSASVCPSETEEEEIASQTDTSVVGDDSNNSFVGAQPGLEENLRDLITNVTPKDLKAALSNLGAGGSEGLDLLKSSLDPADHHLLEEFAEGADDEDDVEGVNDEAEDLGENEESRRYNGNHMRAMFGRKELLKRYNHHQTKDWLRPCQAMPSIEMSAEQKDAMFMTFSKLLGSKKEQPD